MRRFKYFLERKKKLESIKNKLEPFDDLELAISTSGYIEITQKDAQKGKALEHLCRYLGIHMEEVMAIGDNENDHSMLVRAGYPIAMGNANEEIKKIAKYVTASNDESGVCQKIDL